MVPGLLPDPHGLAVGIREDPLRQPDGVRAPGARGILPDGVTQLGQAFAAELGHLPGAGSRRPFLVGRGQHDLDRAVADSDLVVWRRRARRGALV